MEGNDKPFACTVDGCNMSFTNEDHLTVHKKKHDMVLNLGFGQKTNVFVADQTPTPTRFIRNCEEVGLFQDLQNVNPFEETFRKAVEAAKSGHMHLGVDSLGADDTLHTPRVFPHIATSPVLTSSTSVITDNCRRKSPTREQLDHSVHPSSTTAVGSCENEIRRSMVKVVRQEADTSQKRIFPVPVQQLIRGTVGNDSSSVQLILRMPDGKLVQVQGVSMEHVGTVPSLQMTTPGVVSPGAGIVVLQNSPTMSTTVENKMALAKERLKQQLIKANRGLTTAKEAVPKKSLPHAVRVSEMNGKQHCPSDDSESNSPPNRPTRCSSADDIDEKRKKFLERNRAAAIRCRMKRKSWIQDLERRAEDMQRTNQTLQSEVAALRAEVAQLKTLLLAHKDCPVTHAMAQGVPVTSAPQSQQIINVTVPLLSQNGLVNTVPKSQVVLLNKPSIAKRRSSSNVLSTAACKKPHLDSSTIQQCTPQTLLLASHVTSSENINLVSTNQKTVVSGMMPSVVVTSSQDSSLVPVSVLNQILVPKSLCLSTLEDDSDNAAGITQVIKLNPNVTKTDNTNSSGQPTVKSEGDSDVEIVMEVHRENGER